MCDPNVDTTKGYPRREKDEKTGKMPSWESPYILMVNRGGCTFVKKVSDKKNPTTIKRGLSPQAEIKCVCILFCFIYTMLYCLYLLLLLLLLLLF